MKLKIKLLGHSLCLCPVEEDCVISSEDAIRKDLYAKHINTLTELLGVTQEKLLHQVGFKN